MLAERKIILGITGGIAAYKAAELARELVRQGAEVRAVMTKNAVEFVAPLTFQTLTGHPVGLDMFQTRERSAIEHISLANWGELIIVAPATADILGKVAGGLACDLLSTTIMATRMPVLFVPAMNDLMWENRLVQGNIQKLKEAGYFFLDPDTGALACKSEGKGRMPETAAIACEADRILSPKDLLEETILITAGPTREPFDPVRFISNNSSGKMGFALAAEARSRGARVILVSGPTGLKPPAGVEFVPITTAREMREAVMKELPRTTAVIKAAAVSDYRPAELSRNKIKKQPGKMTISLEMNPDILSEIGALKGKRILVGFAMETEGLLEHARGKLAAKNLDLIVANSLNEEGAGFQCDTNVVKIIDQEGGIQDVPRMEKLKVAGIILDRVRALRDKRADGIGP